MKTDIHTFMITSRPVRHGMRYVSHKSCRENQNTILRSVTPPENRAVYEITWKNIVEPGRLQMKIWRMLIARRIPKTTNTHSEYVTLIAFFFSPLQQWLDERISLLRYSTVAVQFQIELVIYETSP